MQFIHYIQTTLDIAVSSILSIYDPLCVVAAVVIVLFQLVLLTMTKDTLTLQQVGVSFFFMYGFLLSVLACKK